LSVDGSAKSSEVILSLYNGGKIIMVISMNHVKGFDDNTCDYDENNNSN